jgi:hypothetical protein
LIDEPHIFSSYPLKLIATCHSIAQANTAYNRDIRECAQVCESDSLLTRRRHCRERVARRTWQALLDSKGYGVDTDGGGKWDGPEHDRQWVPGFDVSYPLFSPSQQHFQVPFDSNRFPDGPFIEGIRDAAKPGWFDTYWIAPKDCTGDEIISIKDLPSLPPMQQAKKSAPELKPERTVVEQPTDFVSGYETPLEQQNKFQNFGTYGLSRTSHL